MLEEFACETADAPRVVDVEAQSLSEGVAVCRRDGPVEEGFGAPVDIVVSEFRPYTLLEKVEDACGAVLAS